MYDASLYYSSKIGDNIPERIIDFDGKEIDLPGHYYIICHREGKVGTDQPFF